MDSRPLKRRVITTVDANGIKHVETTSGIVTIYPNGEERVTVRNMVATPPASAGEDRDETMETTETTTVTHEGPDKVRVDLKVQSRHWGRNGKNITTFSTPPDFTTAFVCDASSFLRGHAGQIQVRDTRYLPPASLPLDERPPSANHEPRTSDRREHRERRNAHTLQPSLSHHRSGYADSDYMASSSSTKPNTERQMIKYERENGGNAYKSGHDSKKRGRGHSDVIYERGCGYDDNTRDRRSRYSFRDHAEAYSRQSGRNRAVRIKRERSESPTRASPGLFVDSREPSVVDLAWNNNTVVLERSPLAGGDEPSKKRKKSSAGSVRAVGERGSGR